MRVYFGDLHNHCGISYGYGSLENAIARAKSQLDFAAFTGHAMWPDIYERDADTEFIVDFHEAGFQKLREHWKEIREQVKCANGKDFVTFQGYEMHSREYGDYHLVSPDDGLELVQCSSPMELIEKCGAEAIAIPHHIAYTPGYRGIAWDKYTAQISPVVEVFSKHGCSMSEEADYPYYHNMGPRDTRNMVDEGLRRGNHFGFVASTDHHAGFPGSYGDGLAAVVAEECSRKSLWEAIKQKRTYAVTGDKILCDFKVNGFYMGSEITAQKRKIQAHVETEGALDKIVLYKNGIPCYVVNGESYQAINNKGFYKLRIEMGWGDSALYHWDGKIEVAGGEIESYNTYFRGRNVLAPSENTKYDENNINNICTDAQLKNGAFIWGCDTVGNVSTLHPSTSSVLVKIKGDLNTKVFVKINNKKYTATIGELMEYGYTSHMQYYYSEAFKIYKILPEKRYQFDLEMTDDQPESPCDYYHLEVAPKNRQKAYVSPIYVRW